MHRNAPPHESHLPRRAAEGRPQDALRFLALAVCLLLVSGTASAQRGLDLTTDTLTQSVLIHPPIDASGDGYTLSSREHTHDEQLRLADQLARDFMVKKVEDDGVPRAYRAGSRGASNDDWYGWRRPVLAPFAATVVRVVSPDTTNVPGTMNREATPGIIVFEDAEEDLVVAYAHVREIQVDEGDTVAPGTVVAKVGNNGNSRVPHIHVGAWEGPPSLLGKKEGTPLQIQMDLYAEKRFGDEDE